MSDTRALGFVLVVVIAGLVLRAEPAYPWHGTGDITAMAIDPLTPTTLYAGTADRGVFKSIDGGANWSTVLGNVSVSALAVDPQAPSVVYAGTAGSGVFKSADRGASWSPTGLTDLNIAQLAIDPQTPTAVYALMTVSYPLTESPGTGVFKSLDAGETWSATGLIGYHCDCARNFSNVTALAIDPQTRPSTLYAGIYYSWPEQTWGEVLKSVDGGVSWVSTPSSDWSFGILAVDRSKTPSIVYAGGYGFVYKSTDEGASWGSSWTGPSEFVAALAIDPMTASTLYALLPYSGAFKSTDGDATWAAVNTGLTEAFQALGITLSVRDLVIDQLQPTTLYLGTIVGVFKSTNGGDSWIQTGLFQHSPLVSVALDSTSVTGGSPSSGTVVLNARAPAGGVTVMLSSTDAAVAAVPANVTVAAGATSASFSISTSARTSNTSVRILATLDDATRNATLFVYVPTTFLGISLPTTTGGTPWAGGTVHLSAPAPAGGAAVELSSSDPAIATVPGSVTVQAGAWYASFRISTISVAAPTSVTISGAYGGVTRSAQLTLTPPSLYSLSLSPTSVPGGTPSTGTATLNAAAPPGGTTVALRSDNTYVATVPASVTVPVGATSATFAVSIRPVLEPISFEIAATYGGLTASARLSVIPATTATLYSLSLNDASVPSGAPLAGTVTLTARAPAGGATVALFSSNPVVATVPASVTVPAAATSASFAGSTVGCVSTVVTVSGTYEGVTRSAEITVTPPTSTETISIQQADYFVNRQELRVAAKDTDSTTTLRVDVTSTGEAIGQLTKGGDGTYRGQFKWPVNPQNITVRSSLCGSGTKAVTRK